MVHVYLARHGETEENVAGVLQGQTPGHLSAQGKEQAAELGERLRGIKADVVVCSDLQRCIDTTRIALGSDVQLVLEPLLRERDWGRYTLQPIRDALAGGVNNEDSSEGAPEAVSAMFRRAERLMDKWLAEYDGKTVIAIGHGFMNRVLIAAHEGKTTRDVPRMENAEVRELAISPNDTRRTKAEPDQAQATLGNAEA